MTDPHDTIDPPVTSPSALVALTIALSLPILALAQFVAHVRTDEMDPWLYACIGRELWHGAKLYADAWDIKPPGIFWIDAAGLALSRGALPGVWAVCAASVTAFAILFFATCRRLYGWSVAAMATVLAVLYLNLSYFHVGGNRPATFFVLTELACIACYVRSFGAMRAGPWLVGAGILGGLGLCFKQTTLAATIAVFGHLLYLRVRDKQACGRGALAFGLGWLGGIVLIFIGLLLTADLHWAWDGIVAFNRAALPRKAGDLQLSIRWLSECAEVVRLPLILTGATAVFALVSRPVAHARVEDRPVRRGVLPPPHLPALLWCWLIVGLLLALAGPRQRPWYLALALPPLMLLSAHALHLLFYVFAGYGRARPTFPIVLVVCWVASAMYAPLRSQVDAALRFHHLRGERSAPTHAATLAHAVQRHSRPHDTVFVTGYRPDVYWAAERRSAIRYLGTLYLGGWDYRNGQTADALAEMLRRTPPTVILDTEPRSLPELGLTAWLKQQYRRVERINGAAVWVRRQVSTTGERLVEPPGQSPPRAWNAMIEHGPNGSPAPTTSTAARHPTDADHSTRVHP